MQQCTIHKFILSLTKKLVLGCIFFASWPLFSTRTASASSSFMDASSINTAFVGAVSLSAFKNPHFALQKLQKPLSVAQPTSSTPPALQKNISPLSTLPPLKKFTLPELSTPQTVGPTASTALCTVPLVSQSIRIKLENHLPDGALIRTLYKDKEKHVSEDQILHLPGSYSIKIPILKRINHTILTLIALQCLDIPSGSVVEEFSQRELQSEDARKRIPLFRKKQMGRTQLPPLENRENRQKSMRPSTLLKNTLIPIREDERDNETLSEMPFLTSSPSISPTFSQSCTSPSTSSLSLESLPEEA